MTDYKPSTPNVRFQNRTAYDASDRMYAESKRKTEVDTANIKDLVNTTKQWEKGLDIWDKNITRLDKEEIDAIGQISKTLATTLGTDIPNLMSLQAEKTDANTLQRFRELPWEKQQEIRQGFQLVWADQQKNHDAKTDLETRARALNTPAALAYADFLSKGNKRADTAIFRHLMRNNLNNFSSVLKKALGDTEKEYSYKTLVPDPEDKTGKKLIEVTKTFTGFDASTDGELLSILVEQEKDRFYKTTQVGGLNTELIAAYSEDHLNETGDSFLQSEGLRIIKADATNKIHTITADIGVHLDLATKSEIDGIAWNFDTEGEIPADAKQFLEKALLNLRAQLQLAGFENPQSAAMDQFAAGLRLWAIGNEQKKTFVDEMLGVYGPDHPNALSIDNLSKPGTKQTFSELEHSRFGSKGRTGTWYGTGFNEGDLLTDVEGGLGTTYDNNLALTGAWQPIIDGKPVNAKWLKDNPLMTANGLNEAWSDTIQYKLAKAAENGEDVDALKQQLIAELKAETTIGYSNEMMIWNYEPPGMVGKSLELINNETWLTTHVKGSAISKDAFDGYTINEEVIKALEAKGITIVNASDLPNKEQDTSARTQVVKYITSLSKDKNYNAKHEVVADSIMNRAYTLMQSASDQYPTLDAAIKAAIQENKLITDTSDENYIDQTSGEVPNSKYNVWNARFNKKLQEDLSLQEQEAIEHRRLVINETNLNEGDVLSKKVELLSKESVTQAINTFNQKGIISPALIHLAVENNENIFDLLNNQAERHNLGDLKLDTNNPNISNINQFIESFDKKELSTLYKAIGNFSSNTPNIEASRRVDNLINKALRREGNLWVHLGFSNYTGTKLPSNNNILNALTTIQYQPPEGDTRRRAGPLNLLEEDIIKYLPKGKTLQDYEDNPSVQELTHNKFIDAVVGLEWSQLVTTIPIGASGLPSQSTELNKSAANLLRNVFHRITTGDDLGLYKRKLGQRVVANDYSSRLDEITTDEMNTNTKYLLQYINSNTGNLGEQYKVSDKYRGVVINK